LNKTDVVKSKKELQDIKSRFKSKHIDVIAISAITGEGLSNLLNTVVKELERCSEPASPYSDIPI